MSQWTQEELAREKKIRYLVEAFRMHALLHEVAEKDFVNALHVSIFLMNQQERCGDRSQHESLADEVREFLLGLLRA